jgi:hypothetical protein
MKTYYIRLLSYENAIKLIDFINNNDKIDYAFITVGGVGMQITDDDKLTLIENYLKNLDVRYEIGIEHPYKVTKQIISDLKEKRLEEHYNLLLQKANIKGSFNRFTFEHDNIYYYVEFRNGRWSDPIVIDKF